MKLCEFDDPKRFRIHQKLIEEISLKIGFSFISLCNNFLFKRNTNKTIKSHEGGKVIRGSITWLSFGDKNNWERGNKFLQPPWREIMWRKVMVGIVAVLLCSRENFRINLWRLLLIIHWKHAITLTWPAAIYNQHNWLTGSLIYFHKSHKQNLLRKRRELYPFINIHEGAKLVSSL